MIKLTDLTRTCGGCPAQWEGTAEDGREFYARYRHGHLNVGLAALGDQSEYSAVSAAFGERDVPREDGSMGTEMGLAEGAEQLYDGPIETEGGPGWMTEAELADALREVAVLPVEDRGE